MGIALLLSKIVRREREREREIRKIMAYFKSFALFFALAATTTGLKIQIGDQQGKIPLGITFVSWKLTDIELQSITGGGFVYNSTSEASSLKMNQLQIVSSGKFHYRYMLLMDKVDIDYIVTIDQFEFGKTCNLKIDDLKIKFKGSPIDFLYQITAVLIGDLAKALHGPMEKTVCAALNKINAEKI